MNESHYSIEKNNVLDIYELIGTHFDKTRVIVWPSVKKFLDTIETNNKILEIGCGNGKNIIYRPELKMEGCDISQCFLNICSKKSIKTFYSDQRNILVENNIYDYVLSIAVLHHLFSEEDRKKSINEIGRILKIGGKAMIQVWQFPENSKCEKINDKNDYFIEWENEADKKIYKRYYHRFTKDEFLNLFNFDNLKIINYYEEHNNLICIIQKIE